MEKFILLNLDNIIEMKSEYYRGLVSIGAPFSEVESKQQNFLMQIFEITRDESENCLATWDRLSTQPPRSSYACVAIKVKRIIASKKSEVKELIILSYTSEFAIRVAKYISEIPALFPNLIGLEISVNNVSTLPSSFSSLSYLQRLTLVGDDLVEIPSNLLNNMVDLKKIFINAPKLKKIPSLNTFLINLERFSLKNLPLVSEIPPFFEFTPTLQEINFINVGITSLPPSIQHCTALTKLNLVLCAQLSHFPAIDRPSFQFSQLKEVELLACAPISTLPDYLFHSPHLTIFNCVDCPNLALTVHQERILSHTVGVNIIRCRTSDLAHLNITKPPLDFADD